MKNETLPLFPAVCASEPQPVAEPSPVQPVADPAQLITWPAFTPAPSKKSPPAQVSARVKAELKGIGLDCTATSDSYSMGNSVRVRLENVPGRYISEIEAHFSQYQYGHFNGMEDIYECSNSRDDIPQTKHLFVNVDYTNDVRQAAWDWFLDNFHPENRDTLPHLVTDSSFHGARVWNDYADTALWQILRESHNIAKGFWDYYQGGNRPQPPQGRKPAASTPRATDTPPPSAPQPVVPGARVEAHHNDRKGFDYWLVILPQRVDRPVYDAMLSQAKAARGWYSRPWQGTPGGFAFKEQAAAEQFAASLAGEPSAPQPVATGTPAPSPTPPVVGNASRADKLREQAEALQPKIDHCFSNRLANTPKRAKQAAQARTEGHRLERTQKALYALADMEQAGTVPPELASITKGRIYDLLASTTEEVRNGYHGYRLETGKPADTSPAALLLWGMIDDNPERRRQADLAHKLAAVNFANIPGYFPTPAEVAATLLEHIELFPGCTVLEPSAGSGNLCDAIKAAEPGATIKAVERNHSLAEILEAKGYQTRPRNFLEIPAFPTFDFVVMNPPFEQMQDAEHIRHAFKFLKPGGRLVSIMAPSAFTNSNRKAQDWRAWLEEMGGERYDLPAGSFKASGTGVSACYVVIDKPEAQAVKDSFTTAETSATPPVVETSECQPVAAQWTAIMYEHPAVTRAKEKSPTPEEWQAWETVSKIDGVTVH